MATHFGAVPSGNGVRFTLWADADHVQLVLHDGAAKGTHALARGPEGLFETWIEGAAAGDRYSYVVDGSKPLPDPASRFQPDGVHGPSQIVDPTKFQWTDTGWQSRPLRDLVIYELHTGTFTPEGTFAGIRNRLPYLRDLGITAIELMPVADFPGSRNWGYDGVALFAPSRAYGSPDDLRALVNDAHRHGLSVILDVVYNHLGPDGNYLPCFSPRYFSTRHQTEWGEALNFDDEAANGARDFVLGNACYWIREFHLDGLRLDATQSIFDSSDRHILAELVERTRAAALPRSIVITAENEPQCSEHLLPPERGGFGIDGMWNDDFHHTASVALRGSRDGYLYDYTGRAQEFISCAKYGFLYQGQRYGWQDKARGSPLRDVPAASCVVFLDNHDQVANHFIGERITTRTSPQLLRAMTGVLLLGPQTPLLFMGQEFAASAPFTFFADHNAELQPLVHKGRREFLAQFQAYADEAVQAMVPSPSAEDTFRACKLDWSETQKHARALALHRDLLRLRREDPVISNPAAYRIDGATLSEKAFVLRWFTADDTDRLLLVNLDQQVGFDSIPEPMVAPPRGKAWTVLWSSDDARYGGHGIITPAKDNGRGRWCLPAQCAVLLKAE